MLIEDLRPLEKSKGPSFMKQQPRLREELEALLAPKPDLTSLGVGLEKNGVAAYTAERALDLEPRDHIPTGHLHGLGQISGSRFPHPENEHDQSCSV